MQEPHPEPLDLPIEKARNEERKKNFKSTGFGKEEVLARRREHAVQLQKASRDKVISAKRFKWGCPSFGQHEEEEPPHIQQKGWSESEVKAVLLVLGAHAGAAERASALQKLRRILSTIDPPLDLIVQHGVVPLLVHFLTDASAPNQLEAAWCITNIAAGTHEQTLETLHAAPFLISFLESGDVALQEQAAWAIANMAGDSVQCRDVLRAQGALPPMIQLLRSKHASVVQTAAFALCNLMRGQHPRINEAFDAGILPLLLSTLTHPSNEVVIEVLWLLSYLTAHGEPFLRPLVDNHLIPRLIEVLGREVTEMALPLLRVMGNLISRSNAYTDLLLTYPSFLAFLIRCFSSEMRSVRKEVIWAISNLSGGKLEHIQAILQSGLGDLVVKAFKTQPFDIQKEAGYALMNIASEKQNLFSLIKAGVITEFVSFLKVPDIDAVVMGIDFIEMVLKHHTAVLPQTFALK